MTTTFLQSSPSPLIAREAPAKRNPSIPRHVAMAFQSGAGQQTPAPQSASAALRTIVAGCAESGVDVLTLIRPPVEIEIFEAALSSLPPCDLTLNLASGLDGRAELLDAVRRLAAQAQSGELAPENIDTGRIESALSTRGLPPVDLFITAGGGEKLCGALLWQCAYAELIFVDKPWFAFSAADVSAALADYAKRFRKFGGLG